MTFGKRQLITRGLTALAVVALISGVPATGTGANGATTILMGLDSPRGIAAGVDDALIFGQIDGSISELIRRGPNAGTVQKIGSVPATFIAPAVGTISDKIFALTAAGPPGSGAATLYRVTRSKVWKVADIAAYQHIDPDPDNLAGPPDESNPFGVAPLRDGSILVSDAAANDLLRVYPDGMIVTVARLKPRFVAVPEELPDEDEEGNPLPPAGTVLPSEAVATSVTVGADGYYYVGELRGFPATPGKSQIWRIAPDSVNAVCDPMNPNTGACRRFADGFTSIVDLEAASNGSIYVVSLVKRSWLQWQLGLVNPPIGGVFRIPKGGGAATELAPNELILPAGVAVSGGGVFVTTPVFGPAKIVQVQ